MAKKRIRSVARQNPSSGSSGDGSLAMNAGAGVASYATVRLAGRIVKGIAGPNRPGFSRAGKVGVAALALAGAYYLPKLSPKLRKYRMVAMVGALIALVQAVVEEYIPALGGLLDVGSSAPARQIAAAQAQSGYDRQQMIADQLARGRRVAIRSKEDDYYDRMEAEEAVRSGRQPDPSVGQAQYVPPPPGSAQSNGQAADGPGPEYDDEDDYSNGIFGPN